MGARKEGALLRDTKTMFIRSAKLALRSPEAMVMALIIPAVLMIIFVYVFGGAMDVGGISVVNFIVPGLILQCIGQCAQTTAVGANNDVSKGVMDRFRTMPIAKSSVLIGYVLSTVLRNIVTVAIIFGVALAVGFRPQANFIQWLIAIGILMLYMTMIAWMAVAGGVRAPDAEAAGGSMVPAQILPFLSSGFVPTETMPHVLRVFAENQPMTPVINSVRALLLNEPMPDGAMRAALLWCIGLIVLFYVISVQSYKRKSAT